MLRVGKVGVKVGFKQPSQCRTYATGASPFGPLGLGARQVNH